MVITFTYLYLQQNGMRKIKVQSCLLSHLCKDHKVRGTSLKYDAEFHVPTNILSVTSCNIWSSFVITGLDEMMLT
jgi:hypothetical protein